VLYAVDVSLTRLDSIMAEWKEEPSHNKKAHLLERVGIKEVRRNDCQIEYLLNLLSPFFRQVKRQQAIQLDGETLEDSLVVWLKGSISD
jgi:hypothetical protein